MTTALEKAQGEKVALPGKAPDAESGDVLGPAVLVLKALNLLPSEEQGGIRQAFGGPPESVSVLEAGATAASKWWSVAGAAALVPLWASVVGFWGKQPPENQRMLLLGAAIATAAITVAIGYLLASDVRGRAQAMVATIEARAHVAQSVIRAAHIAAGSAAVDDSTRVITPLTAKKVKYTATAEADMDQWTLFLMSTKPDGSDEQYYLCKGTRHNWVPSDQVEVG